MLVVHVSISCNVYCLLSCAFYFFFFSGPATTEIYTLSLHDALPICFGADEKGVSRRHLQIRYKGYLTYAIDLDSRDRKSTRLNSSHVAISYAVFCLKKKKNNNKKTPRPSQTTIRPY